MSSLKTLLVSWLGGIPNGPGAARPRVHRGPVCETLEGRQLLNGAWMGPQTWTGPGAIPAPHIEKVGAGGLHDFAHPTLSASALADLKALEADTQTLQAEIKAKVPAALFDAVKTDAAAIKTALGSTAMGWTGPHQVGGDFVTGNDPSTGVFHHRPEFQGPLPGPNMTMTGATLPAALVTKLEAAGITSKQIAQFQTDAKALQTAIQAVDPTLMAKIETERQTFEKDAPPPAMHFDHIKAMATTSKSG